MYKKIIWISTLALTLAFSQSTLADSWGCREGLRSMVESLKLNDEQKAKIKPVLEQLKLKVKNDVTQMHDLKMQLNQQAESMNMDQATVDRLIDKKTKLIGDMIKAKMMAKNQIFTVLDAQQKTELQNMMRKLEEKVSAKFKSCHEKD